MPLLRTRDYRRYPQAVNGKKIKRTATVAVNILRITNKETGSA
jgi:hypothetical protein